MRTLWFRFMDGDKPSGYVGLVIGDDAYSVFWQIDSHGDPWQCQVHNVDAACSVCFLERDGEDPSETEAHSPPDADSPGWRSPSWVRTGQAPAANRARG